MQVLACAGRQEVLPNEKAPEDLMATLDIYSSPTEYFPTGAEVQCCLKPTFTSVYLFIMQEDHFCKYLAFVVLSNICSIFRDVLIFSS